MEAQEKKENQQQRTAVKSKIIAFQDPAKTQKWEVPSITDGDADLSGKNRGLSDRSTHAQSNKYLWLPPGDDQWYILWGRQTLKTTVVSGHQAQQKLKVRCGNENGGSSEKLPAEC